jgi:hypothetical protein
MYVGFARQRRQVVLTYAPYEVLSIGGNQAGSTSGVLGASPSSGLRSVMGTYDCIPADRLLGGGSGSSSGEEKEKGSGLGREEKEDASAGAAAAAKETGARIAATDIDDAVNSEYPALPLASSFVSSNAAVAAAAAAAAAAPPKPRRPIPLIGTNLDYDTEGYLFRFVSSIPSSPQTSTHKLIAWGGCDPMIASQIDRILASRPDFRVYRSREKQGCAAGWNVILRYMAMHDREEVPWCVLPPSLLEPNLRKALTSFRSSLIPPLPPSLFPSRQGNHFQRRHVHPPREPRKFRRRNLGSSR